MSFDMIPCSAIRPSQRRLLMFWSQMQGINVTIPDYHRNIKDIRQYWDQMTPILPEYLLGRLILMHPGLTMEQIQQIPGWPMCARFFWSRDWVEIQPELIERIIWWRNRSVNYADPCLWSGFCPNSALFADGIVGLLPIEALLELDYPPIALLSLNHSLDMPTIRKLAADHSDWVWNRCDLSLAPLIGSCDWPEIDKILWLKGQWMNHNVSRRWQDFPTGNSQVQGKMICGSDIWQLETKKNLGYHQIHYTRTQWAKAHRYIWLIADRWRKESKLFIFSSCIKFVSR